MLVGLGSKNVHNGNKDLEDGMVLKGIQKYSDVGFLTLFKHFGYSTVGDFLKKPMVPIWIVCSESHHSILFSTDFSLLKSAVS